MAEPDKLPPGMFKRGRIYYVKKMVNGELQKQSTGKKDYKAAFRRYLDIMKGWNDGTVQKKVPTFAAYWERYRSAYTVRKTLRPDGHYSDDYLIVGPLTFFGRSLLSDITKTQCQEFANQRNARIITVLNRKGEVMSRRPVSPGTVARELAFVAAIFQQAVEDGHMAKNPMRKVERPKAPVRTRVLSAEEQEKLLKVLSPRYGRWLLFMLGTGLRIEEARGINPKTDLDLDKRTVTVTRKTRGLVKKVQTLPLFEDDVITVLREQLEADGELWPATQWAVREVLEVACAKAGVKCISPHMLRHTFATRYLQAGGDIYKLSLLMGHSSIRTTEKVYAHLLHEDLLEASKGIKLGLRKAAPGTLLEFKKQA